MERADKVLYFEAVKEAIRYKKVIREGKTWWYVMQEGDWYAISGEPAYVLTLLPTF